MTSLIIFYDSQCPLCCYEIDKLIQHDVNHRIKFVDIFSEEFDELAPGIDRSQALTIIHGIYQNKVIQGIDVNYWAWTLVGKKHWVFLLTTPVSRQIAKLGYCIFARNRRFISSLFSKLVKPNDKQCLNGYCNDPNKTSNHRRK